MDLNSVGIEEDEPVALVPEVVAPEPPTRALAFVHALKTSGLDLEGLLSFLPDVALKHKLDALATKAREIDVVGPEGLKKADAALQPLRDGIAEVVKLFDGTKTEPGPTALAWALHKRLTGLRAEFVKEAAETVESINNAIAKETVRLANEAERLRKLAQAEADRSARELADAAARNAKKNNAPAAVVSALQEQAKTATAPPVSTSGPPKLANTATVEKWKARLVGTTDDMEPNPETCDLTEAQQVEAYRVLEAICQRKVKLAAISFNWSYLNDLADAERKTLELPGLEAFKQTSARAKGRR